MTQSQLGSGAAADVQKWIREVLLNAERLLDDADILASHGRFATATSLCILGLEEIGKVALRNFGNGPDVSGLRGRSNLHVRKQLAATALLQAEVGEGVVSAKLKEWGIGGTDKATAEQYAELREILAKSIMESREARLLVYVRLGATERFKQLGMYVDEWTLDYDWLPSALSQAEQQELALEARRALRLLGDDRIVRIAKVIYDAELLQPHVPPSQPLPPKVGVPSGGD